jgi:HlyD family secretion protein
MNRATTRFFQLVIAAFAGAALFVACDRVVLPRLVPYFGTSSDGEEKTGRGPISSSGKSEFSRFEVVAPGRLQPRGGVIDVGGLMGDRVGSVCVKEGDRVTEGQPLASLASHDEARAQENATVAQLDEADKRLKAETAYSQSLVEQAKIVQREAQQLDPLDVEAKKAEVAGLKSALDADGKEADRWKTLENGPGPSQKADQHDLILKSDAQKLNAAQALLKKAERAVELKNEAAKAQVEAAGAALERVKASDQRESLKQSLALAKARVDRTILRAPSNGVILKVLSHPGAATGQHPILKMADTSAMYAVAEVPEEAIRLVKPGQPATVESTAVKAPLKACDLQLMRPANASELPPKANNLMVVADVGNVLYFRIFDRNGEKIVDTNENERKGQSREIEDLKTQLEGVWPPHELDDSAKDAIKSAVASIVSRLEGTVERVGTMVFKNEVRPIDPMISPDAHVVEVWVALKSPGEVADLINHQVDVRIRVAEPDGAGKSPSAKK